MEPISSLPNQEVVAIVSPSKIVKEHTDDQLIDMLKREDYYLIVKINKHPEDRLQIRWQALRTKFSILLQNGKLNSMSINEFVTTELISLFDQYVRQIVNRDKVRGIEFVRLMRKFYLEEKFRLLLKFKLVKPNDI